MSERKRYGLLGHPVLHSVSPAMHMAAFEALGLTSSYAIVDVPNAAALRRVIDDLRAGRMHGANVTLPYKRLVLELVDAVAASASDVGAANVLTRGDDGRVTAHNTDSDALAAEIRDLLGDHRPRTAAVIGAGGAALAAVRACKHLGCSLIGVTTRSWVNSESLMCSQTSEDVRALGGLTTPWPSLDPELAPTSASSRVLRLQWCEIAAKADIIVQATSAGMAGGDPGNEVASIVPWDVIPKTAVAYDVVYRPETTPFLQRAEAHDLAASSGLGMLVGQAVRSFQLWTGQKPSVDTMRRAAQRALAESELEGE